jgi:hypothetical protein
MMIGKQGGQWDLSEWGIEQKPGLLDEINVALEWKRFDALWHKVLKASREGRLPTGRWCCSRCCFCSSGTV